MGPRRWEGGRDNLLRDEKRATGGEAARHQGAGKECKETAVRVPSPPVDQRNLHEEDQYRTTRSIDLLTRIYGTRSWEGNLLNSRNPRRGRPEFHFPSSVRQETKIKYYSWRIPQRPLGEEGTWI